METIGSLFSSADDLLARTPDELAPLLLKLAAQRLQSNGSFWPERVTIDNDVTGEPRWRYTRPEGDAITLLINETWEWLRAQGLIMPAPGINGRNGYMVFTPAGLSAAESSDAFDRMRAAKAFPKGLLHPTIADRVWAALMRGDLDDAVFKSFKAVEEAVRDAGGYAAADIGVPLMRKAFHPDNGPLTKTSDPPAERDALSQLFAGAIGSYKNPHSHRTVNLTDVREAQEQVMLATHLLRIVEARKP